MMGAHRNVGCHGWKRPRQQTGEAAEPPSARPAATLHGHAALTHPRTRRWRLSSAAAPALEAAVLAAQASTASSSASHPPHASDAREEARRGMVSSR
jgi:hypothetical protein